MNASMSTLRQAMVYLGFPADEDRDSEDTRNLAPVEEPEERVQQHEQEPAPAPRERKFMRLVHPPAEEELSRITTIHPKSYNDAKKIGEHFREGIPVILNLTDLSKSDATRLVDFSAGLILGLNGHIQKVAPEVFLLTPRSVEVVGSEVEADLRDEETSVL